MLRVALCGGVALEADGRRLPDSLLAGRQGRLVLAYLVCERHRSVPREELADLVWGDALPSSWVSSLSAVVSKLRRLLAEAGLDGPAALASAFGSYRLHLPEDTWVDWEAATAAVERAEHLTSAGDLDAAVDAAREAQEIARRGFLTDDCPWVDGQRQRLRDVQVRAATAEAEAHLLAGERGRAVASARDALALDELREGSYRLLMRALAAAGERGEALRVWERCRVLLVEELGTDPAAETEAVYLSILGDEAGPVATPLPSGVVTFLLTDIVESSALWERNPSAMAIALERHDHLAMQTARAHGGVLLKAKLEGDATVSVFPRASAGALAALALREALLSEPWPEGAAPAVRMALHTGEAIERDGDYFGPALNRAARLRSLADGGQILVSQAVAEVVRDHLPEDASLRSLGERQLRGLTRLEHIFELAPGRADDDAVDAQPPARPPMPAALSSREPFVGRGAELERLATDWATATAGTARATFIAGEPGVGKTRVAGEWARRAREQGALVLYGRCDEELGAPYQPFAEALRVLAPHLGAGRLKSVRGIEELARLVPELADLVPGLPAPSQADPDSERYLLFDALARLVAVVSAELPILIVVDDLHWAAKPTLLLLRHLLRSGDGSRLQIVGTYRSTDLDRTHPLAGVLADLHRDGTADRITLAGLDAAEVAIYLSAAGYDDAHLGAALSTVTSGNPFFLIEVLRHVEESGGAWDPSTLPQGVREAVGRRLSRLSDQANEALLVAAVAGSRFSIELIEHVLERDLVDAIEEARHAGLVLEEPDHGYRFNHALVRQSLLSEIASVKRTRLHQRVAAALEADTSASGDAHLAELARHYFECAFAGGAAKAVDYSRRAGEQAMARLAYEEAADLYDRAIQAADIDGSGASDDDRAELLLARCEALLAAGDPTAATAVVNQLQGAARNSPRLLAWATCFAGQLAVLTHPERLDATANDVAAAAQQFAQLDDAEGEAKAHTVRASCLARLGRIADCEAALDQALTAGRRAGNPRRVNAVLAGAPLAALWGPSPVARASGRCLDVVRVLRITTGSPAVEAIALRCQAVLEAFRGRTEAARRMLGSARRSLEGLGHTHGLLETDVFSGIVELIAGEPGDAEIVLRRAYDGFVARGVGVDAAQAAALLARAVLAQGRFDEALVLTEDSERLAGVDLQAAIAWRSARAEALAQQGRHRDALDAARAAVALADATDALIDQADAHVALTMVLRAEGDHAGAEREARRAVDLYERKGATARVDALQALVGTRREDRAPIEANVSRRRVRPNLASAAIRTAGPAELLASLGQRHAMAASGPDAGLEVVRTDAHGVIALRERFNRGELPLALARLVELHAQDELPADRLAGRRRIGGYFSNTTPFVWSADAVLIDHRRASLGTLRGREEIRTAARALRELAGDVRRTFTDVLGVTDDVFLFDIINEGRTDSGESFELAMLAMGEFDDDGAQLWAEWFEPEQVDEALARFDEVTGSVPPTRRRVRPNLASRCLPGGPLDGARLGTWEADLSEDFVCIDHNMQVRLDRGQQIEMFRLMATGGEASVTVTLLATLGDRHCVNRCSWRSAAGAKQTVPGAAEANWLNILQTDTSGRLIRLEGFKADQLSEAVARLTELHADAELPATDHDVRYAIGEAFRSTNTRWAEDAVLVDHRPTSLGTLRGRDAIAAAAKALRAVAGEQRRRLHDVLGLTERHALFEMITEGKVDAGGPFEMTVLALTELGDSGVCRRQDWYAPEQLDEALARFDELSQPSPTPRRRIRPNLASRCLASGPMDDVHLDAWITELSENFVSVDHRMQMPVDRNEMIATWRLMATSDSATIEVVPLATLGDRHCVTRDTWRSGGAVQSTVPGEAEVTWLNVLRTDASGRAVRLENFDVDRLDEALARLVELHADDELPPDRHDERYTTAAMFRNTQTRWHDDAVLADHRPTSLGTLTGRDAIAHAAGALRGVAGDLRRRFVDVLGATERLWLFEFVTEGTVDAGGPFELSVLALVEAGGDGLCRRQDWYAPEQIREALARFDELAAATTAEVPANRAAGVLDQLEDAIVRGDMAAYASRTNEDAVVADRRSLFQYTWEGRDACVAHAQSLFTTGVTHIKAVNLATRGEQLVLRREWYWGQVSEAEALYLDEITPDGLNLFGCVFDRDDVDAAFAELDARYLTGEGASNLETLEPIGQLLAAYNRQDWKAWRTLLADDFEVVDHRPAPALYGAVTGPDEFTAALLPMFELASGVRARAVSFEVVRQEGAVVQVRTNATTTDGADIELAFYLLFAVDARVVQRMEFFAVDQLDAARTRLNGLAAPTSRDDGPSNTASRAWTNLMARYTERDWDAFALGVTDGAVADDRRTLVGGIRYEGKADFLEMWRSVAAIGVTDVSSTPIAVRGDRLVAVRTLVAGSVGEAELLFAHRFTDDGRYLDGYSFDPDDLRAVYAQLDALYAAQLSPEQAEVWRLSTALTDLYNGRDLDGLLDIFAPHAVIVDERVTGWGTLDRASFVEHLQELVGMAPDAFLACVEVYEVSSHGSAGRFRVTGTGPGGGEFEIPFECVSTVRDGRLVRLELLPQGSTDRARPLA